MSTRVRLFALALSVLACVDSAAAAAPGDSLALVGGRVIDGFGGPPLDNATILIKAHRIVQVGPSSAVQIPPGARRIDTRGMTLLPGLWESNGHLSMLGEGVPAELDGERAPGRVMQTMAVAARVSLLAGITSFRDCGGPLDAEIEFRHEIEAGKFIGPRLLIGGPQLHQQLPDSRPVTTGSGKRDPYIVASPQEAGVAVRRLADAGADLVFLAGSWNPEIMREVVAVAHRARIGVDAEVRHATDLHTAIFAGVDRLHHVFIADPLSGYSEDDWRLMVAGAGGAANTAGAAYVIPTVEMRKAYARVFEFPGWVDNAQAKRMYATDVYEKLRNSWNEPASIPWGLDATKRVAVGLAKIRTYIEKGGVTQLLAGTDAGSPLNLHGALAREIRNLHEAGLSPMEAIQSATMRPAKAQGMLADLGTLTTGKLADIVVVDGDPLQDLSLLEHGIVMVVKNGSVYQPEPAAVHSVD